MRKVWLIAWLDLLVFLRNRGNLLQLTFIPVVLTLVLGYALGGSDDGPQRIRLDVVDEDDSAWSRQLPPALGAQGPALRLCPGPDEECAWPEAAESDLGIALQRLRDGDADALLHIPPDSGASIDAGQGVVLPLYANVATAPQTNPAWSLVECALGRLNGVSVAGATAAALHAALKQDEEERADYVRAVQAYAAAAWTAQGPLVRATQTDKAAAAPAVPGGFSQSVPGIASFYVIFSVMGGAMSVLIRERREGTLARMATLPLRRSEVIGGKILARFLTGMLQFLIIFAVGVVTGLDFGRAHLALLLLMVSYALCITALGITLGSRLQHEEQGAQLTALLAILMAALGGAWWPLSIAPPFMQVIGHLTPVAWAMDGFHELILRGGGLAEVLPALAVLSGYTVALFVLGLRRFRFR